MNVGSSRPPPTVDLEDDATPPDETVPINAVLHARPPGQKAQKAAKKKGKFDEAALMRAQIQRFADQADRDYALRQQLIEDTKTAEERAEQNKEAAARRADDAHTMTINPSQFTPVKMAYWERKQRRILQREEECDADMPHSQSHDGGNRSNLSLYVPVHDTDFLD